MESDLRKVLDAHRRIVGAVKVAPFVYGAFCTADLLFSVHVGGAFLFGELFFTSPLIVAIHLWYSKILHLCKWHRRACRIPLLPVGLALVNRYVVDFTDVEAIAVDAAVLLSAAALFVSAYKTFLR